VSREWIGAILDGTALVALLLGLLCGLLGAVALLVLWTWRR
jgi:hypothetical protein